MSNKEETHDSPVPTKGKEGATTATTGSRQNQVGSVMLFGVPIVSLVMDGKERLCLAQISSTLLKDFSYNEIHNRRVALGINCVQCTPVQLEILRRAGAMPVTSRRCGMITRREAERLCKSFLGDHAPPQLPENFAFDVYHECGWGCRGSFVPSRYNSSRAKCIRCSFCQLFFSPNKFIFHSHRLPESRYVQPDAANFNSWRRHMKLCGDPPEEINSTNSITDLATAQIVHAWEDVKAMFNGGTRKRLLAATIAPSTRHHTPRHSSSSHSNTGGSAKGSISNRNNHSHGENQNSSANNSHSRNINSHQAKKESNSVSATPVVPVANAAQHATPESYTQDAPHHSANFLHQSQNPFLNMPNPLLSPTGRLDSIWNPALSGSMVGQGPRNCQIPGSSPFPALPLHPLSIPWLRRPLFPFSHPFGPTIINDPNNPAAAAPEKLVNLTVARQNQSAFKPVSRSVEPLFNWLNGSSLAGAGINLGATASLPEDLSVNSSGHTTPGTGTSGSSPGTQHFTPNNNHIVGSTTYHSSKHIIDPQATASGEKSSRHTNFNNGSSTKHHQIQILSAHQNESDDEENVDIESTVETEECSSTTSSVWVSSTSALQGGGRAGATTPRVTSPYNNNNNTIIGYSRRKRLAVCYSSGDDVDDDDDDRESSDNPDDTASDHYEDIRPGERERRDGKKKRLWVNEIIADEDDSKLNLVAMKKGHKLEGKLNKTTRVLLETSD